MGGPAALDLCYSVMTIGPIWTSQSSSFHAWRTRILYHKTDVLLFHGSSYICISVTRIFFPVFFLNANVGVKQLRGQGPPSRRIADKPKWRNFLPSLRHMGVRKAFTNKMRHKNRLSGSPSWSHSPCHNQIFQHRHWSKTLSLPAQGWRLACANLLLFGFLIEPNWRCDRWGGRGTYRGAPSLKTTFSLY